MSLNPLIKTFYLTIRPSLRVWLLIVIPHLLAILLIVSFGVFPLWSKVVLIITIAVSFTYYYRSYFTLKLNNSIVSIEQDSVKNWFIVLYGGGNNEDPRSVHLLPSSFISNVFIVLNFQDNSGLNYSTIIISDSISSRDFKYLYKKLKLTYIK